MRVLRGLRPQDQRPIARVGIYAPRRGNLRRLHHGLLRLLRLLTALRSTATRLPSLFVLARTLSGAAHRLLLLSLLLALHLRLLLPHALELRLLLLGGVEHLLDDVLGAVHVDVAHADDADVRFDGEVLDLVLEFVQPIGDLIHHHRRAFDDKNAFHFVVVDLQPFAGGDLCVAGFSFSASAPDPLSFDFSCEC